jgi:hypothetical protein
VGRRERDRDIATETKMSARGKILKTSRRLFVVFENHSKEKRKAWRWSTSTMKKDEKIGEKNLQQNGYEEERFRKLPRSVSVEIRSFRIIFNTFTFYA